MPPPPLGSTLRQIRTERGLGTQSLATLAGTTKRSILDWESDRHTPSGPALERLLGVLDVAESERARLLAHFAPVYARTRLAHEPLGAPIHRGQILRAMRLRRGWTQADLARGLGITQGALAKWETGLTEPTEDALERALDGLLATPEERAALRATAWTSSDREDPTDVEVRIGRAQHEIPFALRAVALLGLEAELWWRATTDASVEPHLCRTIGVRAQNALMRGALDEVDELARRAIRLAQRAGAYEDGTVAVYARCWIAQRRPDGARQAVRLLRRWLELVRDDVHRDWLRAALALALVRGGETDDGINLLEELDRKAAAGDSETLRYHRVDLIEGLLLSGRPGRAYDLLAPLGDTGAPATIARAHLALGLEPSDATMSAVRASAMRDWMARSEAALIERGLRAVRRGGRATIF